MDREVPLLFQLYSKLRNSVPWIPLLTNIPTPIEKLENLEKKYGMSPSGGVYIKRDDINHGLYGGNKLRKFEFIFGKLLEEKKKGVITFGGIGTNHGLACAIVARQLNLHCDLFLAYQPLTWHVQRSLLLYDYFGAHIHYAKSYTAIALKALFFRLIHPKYYFMLPGGSTLLGRGSPNGTLGFINAAIEIEEQIKQKVFPEPEVIFIPCGSGGSAAGLIAGCKLLNLKTRVYAVEVSNPPFSSEESIIQNSNKALKYLRKRDKTIPQITINKEDFTYVKDYLGSDYGIKTRKGQTAIDLVMQLEGKERGFKLETTYSGKAMAALLDYIGNNENKEKNILFWDTYNSADLDRYLKETHFYYKKLPRQLHQFYEKKHFQCWQYKNCPQKEECSAYLNHDYRCWKVKQCTELERNKCSVYTKLDDAIILEDT
ncbi:MAG: hypothetical protein BAJALOKI1v1_1550004 [Promethearchaeota archaeon]|nr:MAG: hypothetical protein BAJALOKI1v1_1550004 [Candidatus Lokiarchaeota archaeon]